MSRAVESPASVDSYFTDGRPGPSDRTRCVAVLSCQWNTYTPTHIYICIARIVGVYDVQEIDRIGTLAFKHFLQFLTTYFSIMASGGSKIRMLRLAHVHYQHPDLQKAHEFLVHFGLEPVEKNETRIYYRGYGKDAYCYLAELSPTGTKFFGGGAFVVESYDDLEKASRLPGASLIEKAEGPGGGHCVILKDPNDMAVKLLYGQEEMDPSMHPSKYRYNTAQEKDRIGDFHRMKPGPTKVHKLGHYGFMMPEDRFEKTRQWYLDTFNMSLTDTVYNAETGQDETSFLHIDLGETYVDHHVS